MWKAVVVVVVVGCVGGSRKTKSVQLDALDVEMHCQLIYFKYMCDTYNMQHISFWITDLDY